MPRDPRVYITVHHGMPKHPKIFGLSDKAFRVLVEAWCWCSENETDGKIPLTGWAKMGTPKVRAELVSVGMIELGSVEAVCHDYLEHQRSAAEIAAMREMRASAGSKGGKVRAQRLASAKAHAQASASENGPDSQALAKQNSSKGAQANLKQITDNRTNSPSVVGSRNVPAGIGPRIVRAYVEAAHDAGMPAPEEAQARVERAARSLCGQGFAETDVTQAARNAAVEGWTDLSVQMQRDAARSRPAVNGRGGPRSTTDQKFLEALALSQRLDAEDRKVLP